MRQFLCLVLLATIACQLGYSRIAIRNKRQIERESGVPNESTVVVSGDRESSEFEVPESQDPKTDVMEVDFDEQDGTFSFGGRFPALNPNFHDSMNKLFRQLTQRFEEMTRSMTERFNNATAEYPANYNGTKEEVITIDGKQYIKKTNVIKKTNENTAVFLSSTTYEPVDQSQNES